MVKANGLENPKAIKAGSSSTGEELIYEKLPCKFAKFNNILGILVVGFENEINSLPRKMEARKGCRVKIPGGKRKTFSSSSVEREIQKLECLVNYNSSPLLVRGKKGFPGGRGDGV